MHNRTHTFFALIREQNYNRITYVLDRNPSLISQSVDADHETAFHKAVRARDLTMVLLLLKYSTNIAAFKNFSGINPIVLAAQMDQWECVLAFVAKCKEQNDTLEFDAVGIFTIYNRLNVFNHHDNFFHPLPRGATSTDVLRFDYRYVLLIAAQKNQLQVIEALIKATGWVAGMSKPIGNWYTSAKEITNGRDETGNTPLHYAVLNRNLPLIRLLLENGADLSVTNHENQTPLSLAAASGFWEILIDLAKSQKKDKFFYGYAILLAAFHNQTKVVNELLHGETLPKEWYGKNKKNNALHYAVINGNPEMVAILMQHRANPNEVNHNQKTPSALAVELNHLDCLEALINPHKFLPAKPTLLKAPAVMFQSTTKEDSEKTPLLGKVQSSKRYG